MISTISADTSSPQATSTTRLRYQGVGAADSGSAGVSAA